MITNKARAAQNSCQERWRDSPSLTRPSCFSRDISKHNLQGRRGSLPRLQPIPNANSCYAKCWRTGMFKKWQSGKTVIHRESLVHYSSDPQTTPHRQLVVKKSFCRIWGSIVDVSFTVSHSGGRERGSWVTNIPFFKRVRHKQHNTPYKECFTCLRSQPCWFHGKPGHLFLWVLWSCCDEQ